MTDNKNMQMIPPILIIVFLLIFSFLIICRIIDLRRHSKSRHTIEEESSDFFNNDDAKDIYLGIDAQRDKSIKLCLNKNAINSIVSQSTPAIVGQNH